MIIKLKKSTLDIIYAISDQMEFLFLIHRSNEPGAFHILDDVWD